MQLNDFHVVIATDNNRPHRFVHRFVYYGDSVDDLKDEYDDVKEVKTEDYTISDYVEIAGSLLEDVNAHKYCNKPRELVDTMKEAGISDEDILRFMSLYVVKLFKEYGY